MWGAKNQKFYDVRNEKPYIPLRKRRVKEVELIPSLNAKPVRRQPLVPLWQPQPMPVVKARVNLPKKRPHNAVQRRRPLVVREWKLKQRKPNVVPNTLHLARHRPSKPRLVRRRGPVRKRPVLPTLKQCVKKHNRLVLRLKCRRVRLQRPSMQP